MNDQPIKKQTFLQGTAVLAMATVLVKLMGFLFKVPLNNIIGEDGFGYFNTAYDVYNVLLMISTTGLPVAMSRMISQAQTLGNHAQIRRIYKTSLYVFLTIGVVGSLGMLIFCKPLSVMVTTNENSWAAIAALAPCVLLICIVSAHRGFFQGQSNMIPTSISQVVEAVVKLIVGMAAALKEACDHLPEHTAKVSALRDKLIAGLEAIPHGALNGDRNHRLPGNVSFCFEGIEGESMLLLLDDRGICASSGSACTSGSLDPSHVLLAIGRPHEVAHGSLRLSLCEENTEQEVDVMLREIPQVIDYLRNMSPVWRKLQKGECSYVIQ